MPFGQGGQRMFDVLRQEIGSTLSVHHVSERVCYSFAR